MERVTEKDESPSHSPRLLFGAQLSDTILANVVNVPTINEQRVKRGAGGGKLDWLIPRGSPLTA